MAKKLVIVESPAKARTIGKYLGREYSVISSMGHVRDLPSSKLGVDLKKDFQPTYVPIKGKAKVLAQIKAAAAKAERIFIATDPDREGEAIAWHIAAEIEDKGRKARKVQRAMFYEITKESVAKAIAHPGKIDQKKVDAQQARRILDRLVGYQVSPFLWKTVRRGLSAGRVQTVALRLICEREGEIKGFKPQEYWTLAARLQGGDDGPFEASLSKIDDKKPAIRDQASSGRIVSELGSLAFSVAGVDTRDKKRHPYPPFITSTLQQAAYRGLGFSAKKTMSVAQQLYEGIELGDEGAVGLITYMRTDSVRMAPEAAAAARAFISAHFGAEYLPPEPRHYRSRKSAQEGHEAIRPTAADRTPESVGRFLTPDQLKLYGLIWSRFLACQMASAVYSVRSADIRAGRFLFRASGSRLAFNGFLAAYGVQEDDSDQYAESKDLPKLEPGESLKLLELLPKQHFTEPPPRFNEASLIKALEAAGIGRPSTYAVIISTIIDREYATKERGPLEPTELGMVVNKILTEKFPHVFQVQFTADMESELDKIEQGKLEWVRALKDFYGPFSRDLKSAEADRLEVKKSLEEKTDTACPECGQPMVIKWGRFGKFYACSRYPDCKTTMPMDAEQDLKDAEGQVCDKCGSPMKVKRSKFGKFLACSNYPQCQSVRPITTGVPCPEPGCGGQLAERRSKRGRSFYSCTRYPDCKYAVWNRPIGQACESCGFGHLVQRYSKARGQYPACPKCKWEPPTEEAKKE
ncbi:MAG TPA: type I DNA topoisomerase [candidate division Zixibacteria bacterium]|nr:type I DNA topoisomerase [candidate division Zixibacteria bacterium]